MSKNQEAIELLEEIKNIVVAKCQAVFQYCGVAESDKKVIINTGGIDDELKITIEMASPLSVRSPEDKQPACKTWRM